MREPATRTEQTSFEADAPGEPTFLGLCVMAGAGAPVGAVGLVVDEARRWVLGRGAGAPGDADPRLPFVTQRPGSNEPAPALATDTISRHQLEITALPGRALHVRNVGKARLRHGGAEVGEAIVRLGDTLQLGAQVLLLCVERPLSLPALPDGWPAYTFGGPDPFGIVGESPAIHRLRHEVAFAARRAGHVLVQGESGTGKESVARAIHLLSSRAGRAFLARNAATIPEALVDAELFGNARNYPNAGMPERAGLCGEADGGTILLDEIGDLPPAVQPHLLRVLDAGEYTRLGETKPRRADLRVVGATNRPDPFLKHDLLARFAFRVRTPTLQARREDVPLLVAHLLAGMGASDPSVPARFLEPSGGRPRARVATALLEALLRREYDTHVRELQAILWSCVADSRGDVLQAPASLPTRRTDAGPASAHAHAASAGSARDAERAPKAADPQAGSSDDVERLQQALDASNGSIEDAYRALGLPSRHALARLIKKHGLEVRRRAR